MIVSLIRCTEYKDTVIAQAIERLFSLLGGIERFVKRGDMVLLKPNFIAPKPRHCAAQTDPAILIATVKLLKDFGCKPVIGDSPAWANITACAKALDIETHLKKLDVPVRQLNKPVRQQIAGVNVGISSVALDADVIINLPKFKSHQQLAATFAIKNMFGCVSGKWKAYWHFAKGGNETKFCKFLIEIYKHLAPALTIIDAVIAMDGPGPINGRARPLGWIIGGTDPIACEFVCSRLINLDPDSVPIIKTAKKIGFGETNPENIEILGDPFPKNACTDFIPAEPIPIRFSLPRVCKSICRQIILLAKTTKK